MRALKLFILLALVTSCAKEPTGAMYDYEERTEGEECSLVLRAYLMDATAEWLDNNLDLKEYQLDMLNMVLVPALAEEMKWGLPLEVMTAQAILESGWGRSELATKHNNYFGIKAYRSERGVIYVSDEYVSGKRISKESSFRTYDSPQACFTDRSEWFLRNYRYNDLDFRNIGWQEFTKELQERGYATDINYTKSLNRIIKKYKLTEYSNWIQKTL